MSLCKLRGRISYLLIDEGDGVTGDVPGHGEVMLLGRESLGARVLVLRGVPSSVLFLLLSVS